jgi:hypothetical protein
MTGSVGKSNDIRNTRRVDIYFIRRELMRISHEDICSMQFVIEINILQTIVYLGKNFKYGRADSDC